MTKASDLTSQSAQAARTQGGSYRAAILAILVASALATAFLFWLIYLHPAPDASGQRYEFLPAVNAILNGLSAVALSLGFVLIRAGRPRAHRVAMSMAFGFSTLFLAGYIAHHALHGDVLYPRHAALRGFYLTLLVSHILLATVALPLVLATFFFALTARFRQHRRLARWTLPIWLYVSVTGVAVYILLRLALAA